MKTPAYTMTADTITIVWDGQTHTIFRRAPQFKALQTAIINENWAAIPNNLTVSKSIQSWAKGKFEYDTDGKRFKYEGQVLPYQLNERITKMAAEGSDPCAFFAFWERVQRNPSKRSVDQLWSFLAHNGIPLEPDGTFLAYKGVKDNLTDAHTGTFDNTPGKIHQMPRNQISDDPNEACHEGFHVGALAYAQTFSRRVVICRVCPEDVVCIPYDSSAQKMRVSKYEVIGFYSGVPLSSTVHEEEVDVQDEIEQEEELERQFTEEAESVDDDEYEQNYSPSYNDAEEDRIIQPLTVSRKSKRGFAKYDKLDMQGLLKSGIEELRRYANKGLLIVGASKIPGGKVALVAKILECRR